MTKWSQNKGYGLFINEHGCLELRINDQKISTGAQIRDHAWHFVAATFDAKSGTAILYHEPQIVYALDPEIPPVQKKIDAKIQHDDTPFVIAGYALNKDSTPQAQASVPKGVVIGGHYNGKIDSPRVCNRALTRLEIETMKAGASTGQDERRGSGPTAKLSENDRSGLGFFRWHQHYRRQGSWSLPKRRHHRKLPDPRDDRSQLVMVTSSTGSTPRRSMGQSIFTTMISTTRDGPSTLNGKCRQTSKARAMRPS